MDIDTDSLSHLSAEELREMVQSLRKTVTFKQAAIDKLTHENALLKRLKFAAQSERFNAEQRSLLEETLDEDLQAVSEENTLQFRNDGFLLRARWNTGQHGEQQNAVNGGVGPRQP